jgi:glycosyltransferase involved in cell wall biosynthesis
VRILFITAHKYLPQMYGGSQSSTHELCHGLERRGHHVAVLAGLMPGKLFALRVRIKMQINRRLTGCQVARETGLGYPVWYSWFPWDAVAHVVSKENPDVIVALAFKPVLMALAARRTGRPVLVQLQDVEFEQHGGPFEELGKIPCIANSHFTAGKYHAAYGVEPTVIAPFVLAERYKTTTTRENITFINPHPNKGRDIAIEIARQCPDIPFVFVESWPLSDEHRAGLMEKIAPLANVTLRPPQGDMLSIYGKCRILLAPSVWEEAYGRVATEAQISGIPVVASDRGGLPEAVANGGILISPERPIAEWVSAIRKLWNNASYYNVLSAAAHAHASRPELSRDCQIEAFERAAMAAAGIAADSPIAEPAIAVVSPA